MQLKKRFICFLAMLLLSLATESQTIEGIDFKTIKKITSPAFQKLLDSVHVKGSVLIYDPQHNVIYSNDFERCKQGFLPASTFKIPNSIIALELGIIKDDLTILKWNGEKRRLSVWEQDLIFRDAFQYSCVPCYQEIARKIGVNKMELYLKKLQFGNMNVDSVNIDKFWLEGDSKITSYQQMDFIYRFYTEKLPINKKTYDIMRKLLFIESSDIGVLSGKTGWAIRNNMNIGWFVGYLNRKGNTTLFIVTNIEPEKEFDIDMFPLIRKEISLKALKSIAK